MSELLPVLNRGVGHMSQHLPEISEQAMPEAETILLIIMSKPNIKSQPNQHEKTHLPPYPSLH